MEVSKKQAAQVLGISAKEVMRRIESGELKGRKKTESKFSDWLVEVPENLAKKKGEVESKVIKAIKVKPKPKLMVEPEPLEQVDTVLSPTPEPKPTPEPSERADIAPNLTPELDVTPEIEPKHMTDVSEIKLTPSTEKKDEKGNGKDKIRKPVKPGKWWF